MHSNTRKAVTAATEQKPSAKENTLKGMLTTRQVADILAVHPSTVRHYVATRQLHAHRLGRYFRFKFNDLEQFVGNHEEVATWLSQHIE